MILRAAMLAAASILLAATVSSAQTDESIPRFVADVRGASAGLPTAEGWTPVVPAGAQVPSRALGLEAGAHVRIGRVGPVTFGIGASLLTARGTVTPEPGEPTDPGTPAPAVGPEVSTRFTSITPQLSLNFGRRLGWSYVSAGLGRGRVSSEASEPAGPGVPAEIDRDWSRVLNYGAGARWFINDHFGVGFDLRWYQLASVAADATRPAAPRTTMFTAAVGISLQ